MKQRRTVNRVLDVPSPDPPRTSFLADANRRRPIVGKTDLILSHCTDRTVLDIGCINHSADNAVALGDDWLHHRIRGVARSVTGVDMLAGDAAVLNERGYDIEAADAQNFDLGQTFDVVVAADVIEHLTNLSGFLRSARRHMHQGSTFILTTPNPFAFAQMMQVLLRGRAVVNAEHTIWLDPSVAYELLSREGLRPAELLWIESDPGVGAETWATRLLSLAAAAAGRLRPLVRANYAVVARLPDPEP